MTAAGVAASLLPLEGLAGEGEVPLVKAEDAPLIDGDGIGSLVMIGFVLVLFFCLPLLVFWAKPFTRIIDRVSVRWPQNPWSKPPTEQKYVTGGVASWLPAEAEFDDGTISSDAPWYDWSGSQDSDLTATRRRISARRRISELKKQPISEQALQERIAALDRLVEDGVLTPENAEERRAGILERYRADSANSDRTQ